MLLFFDVDTQNDFLLPTGALYVSGGVGILPTLGHLTSMARRNGIRIMASMDAHTPDDPEFIPNGGAFPPHCVKGTPGQEKVRETALPDAILIPPGGFPSPGARDGALDAPAVILEKRVLDVFSNPATSELVRPGDHAVVYGVATEYCVRSAVLGLLSRGVTVELVADAIRGVDEEHARRAIRETTTAGAVLTAAADALERHAARG